MKKNWKKAVVAALILLISLPTIVEGSSVLLGISRPDQIILSWLVAYNVTAALLSLGVLYAIFRTPRRAPRFSLVILTAHLTVLAVLVAILFTSGEVAQKSIAAMSLRSTIWLAVFIISGKIQNRE